MNNRSSMKHLCLVLALCSLGLAPSVQAQVVSKTFEENL